MTFKETMANLFSASEGAYYKWKRENRPIIQLIDRYFSKDDIEEFLKTGKINKFEEISDLEALNNEAVNIYSYFVLKLDPNSLLLFLTVIHTSNINNQDINSNFIELIFDTNAQKKDKINLINEFQKIQNSTLFFYAIKYLVKNKFEKFLEAIIDSNYLSFPNNISSRILHTQLYISIFLQKEYMELDQFKEAKRKENLEAYKKGQNLFPDANPFEFWDSDDTLELSYLYYLKVLIFGEKPILKEEGFEF